MKNLLRVGTVITFLLLFGVRDSLAIPAFARKYEASCQTCHIAYPKLNQFGNTFRLLGYRMPGETEDQVKVPDVSLGAPAYKKVWPQAVWPGAIPGQIPVAVVSEFLVQNISNFDDGEREITSNDFLFPSAVEIILGGTAGDHVAYFGEIEFEQEVRHGEIENEVSIGHADLRFIAPFSDSMAFNVKIGSFQPEIVNTFDHARRLTVANYDSMFAVGTVNPGGAASVGGGGHHGGSGLALPAVVRGFEFYGILAHRFFWTAGAVNGLGVGDDAFDGNSSKDAYAKIAYKWGGLSLDGHNSETYVGSEKNWREKSLQLGAFAYYGSGRDIFTEAEEEDPNGMVIPLLVEDHDFTRFGADFNLFFNDVNVFGAWVRGEDDLRVFGEDPNMSGLPGPLDPGESGEFDYVAWFLEVDAVLGVPWLHGAARYETVDLPHEMGGMEVEDFETATASLTGLVRANVKTTLEYSWDLNESKNYRAWLRFGLAF